MTLRAPVTKHLGQGVRGRGDGKVGGGGCWGLSRNSTTWLLPVMAIFTLQRDEKRHFGWAAQCLCVFQVSHFGVDRSGDDGYEDVSRRRAARQLRGSGAGASAGAGDDACVYAQVDKSKKKPKKAKVLCGVLSAEGQTYCVVCCQQKDKRTKWCAVSRRTNVLSGVLSAEGQTYWVVCCQQKDKRTEWCAVSRRTNVLSGVLSAEGQTYWVVCCQQKDKRTVWCAVSRRKNVLSGVLSAEGQTYWVVCCQQKDKRTVWCAVSRRTNVLSGVLSAEGQTYWVMCCQQKDKRTEWCAVSRRTNVLSGVLSAEGKTYWVVCCQQKNKRTVWCAVSRRTNVLCGVLSVEGQTQESLYAHFVQRRFERRTRIQTKMLTLLRNYYMACLHFSAVSRINEITHGLIKIMRHSLVVSGSSAPRGTWSTVRVFRRKFRADRIPCRIAWPNKHGWTHHNIYFWYFSVQTGHITILVWSLGYSLNIELLATCFLSAMLPAELCCQLPRGCLAFVSLFLVEEAGWARGPGVRRAGGLLSAPGRRGSREAGPDPAVGLRGHRPVHEPAAPGAHVRQLAPRRRHVRQRARHVNTYVLSSSHSLSEVYCYVGVWCLCHHTAPCMRHPCEPASNWKNANLVLSFWEPDMTASRVFLEFQSDPACRKRSTFSQPFLQMLVIENVVGSAFTRER